jgi:phosphoribosyl 1,2-cyclic phosphodiesterase
MKVQVLASGSSGNAALVSSGETTLLIDTGISAMAICRRMEAFGCSLEQVSAILLTHEHGDHMRGIDVLQRRRPIPVWATAGTWLGVDRRVSAGGELRSGRETIFGSLRVLPVATSHDAREPIALVIEDGTTCLGFCTDTGILTSLLVQRLAECNLLLLEANHDADMLRHGPYPWPLKQRIASRLGHLANHQSQEGISRFGSARLRGMVALHLSEQNNRPHLVRRLLQQALGAQVPVAIATRNCMVGVTSNGDQVAIEEREAPATRKAGLADERGDEP